MPERVESHTAPLFLGLQSYTEAQADRFFGRADEIDRLTNLIKANTLTIVFGKSGTGKTSLLNAGVFPRLRRDYCLPFRIRLEFFDDSPGLVDQIKATLKEEIDKYGFRVESYPGNETLWEYFHREQLWRSVTPILIFDQFEEIFTLASRSTRFGKEETDAFWEELADLVENSIPDRLKDKFLESKEAIDYSYKVQKVKALFSFREEYLPEFEGITAKIPSIKYSRFRLLPLNGNQAFEVITKTWSDKINAAQAHNIVQFFSADEKVAQAYDTMTIEPSLLSQVCSLIERERLHEGRDKISAEFLNRYSKAFILRTVYDEALDESNRVVVPPANGLPASPKPVNELVEEKLITDEGYRTKYALTDADVRLLPGIAVLRSKYFIRDEGRLIELTHDVLTPLIKADREERRKALAMAATRKKARRRLVLITALAGLVAFGIWFFTTREAFAQKQAALNDKLRIEEDIETAKTQLQNITDSIKDKKATPPKDDDVPKVLGVSMVDSVRYAALVDQTRADSLRLAVLNAELALRKKDLAEKDSTAKAQWQNFTQTKKKSDSVSKDARWQIAALQRRITTDSLQLVRAKKNYESLSDMYEKLFTQNPDLIPDAGNASGPPFDPAADTASLKLELFYAGKKGKVPANTKVYLVPFTPANSRIISRAQTYEIRCDEMNLDKARGRKIARYAGGQYVFLNVPPGKYFVKICAYYGGFYTYTKTESGNVTEKMDASPPIR